MELGECSEPGKQNQSTDAGMKVVLKTLWVYSKLQTGPDLARTGRTW